MNKIQVTKHYTPSILMLCCDPAGGGTMAVGEKICAFSY